MMDGLTTGSVRTRGYVGPPYWAILTGSTVLSC